jgi:hypothetical protein
VSFSIMWVAVARLPCRTTFSYVSSRLSPRENSRFFNRLLIKSCGKSQLVTRLPGNMLSCGNNNLKFINFFPCGGSS